MEQQQFVNQGLVLLIFLRLLQGICTGGEIASVTTYITEVGAKESLCRSMMLTLGRQQFVQVEIAQDSPMR